MSFGARRASWKLALISRTFFQRTIDTERVRLLAEPVTAQGQWVVSVVANPASDLLELDDGALVPVRFVTGQGPGVVHVDPPDGLFEET